MNKITQQEIAIKAVNNEILPEPIIITGTSGNDTLNDLLDNNRLVGGRGSDAYVFSKGHGQDIINEQGDSRSISTDTIQLKDVNSADVKFKRIGNHLVLFGYNGTDSITIEHFFTNDQYTIENFEFADKTITYDDYVKNGMTFTSDEAVVNGWNGISILQGNNSNQAFYSGSSNDIINTGNGDNTVNAGSGNDKIVLGTGNNLVLAGDGNDTIIDGSGNSRLVGGRGSDTYVFSKGHGQDFINEQGDARTASTDTIQLKDVNSADVKFDKVGNHLVLSGYNGTDSITVEHFFTYDQYTIENFEFADKTITYDSLYKNGMTFSSNDAVVNGWNGVNIMNGGDNNQTFNGGTSNDIITTGAGNNLVLAGAGNDTIIDGSGNSRLVGGKGSDTYVFSKGHGQDFINEQGDARTASTDTIQLKDVNSADVKFNRVDNHLVLSGYNGTDSVTVEHFFTHDQYTIEKFEFADKTITYDSLYKNGMTFSSNDAVVNGWNGVSIMNGGDNNQTFNGGNSNDVITTGAGNNLVLAGAGNDTIVDGSGNSRLVGGKGSDTYVFSKGHGQDFINEQGDARTASTDTIQLRDVNSADVKFDRMGNHLVLSGYNGTDSVTVEHFFSHDQYTIEKFEFADKTITYDSLYKNGMTFSSNDAVVNGWNGVSIMNGGDNNQTFNGGNSNDIITTGAGNNLVLAGAGNDTIIDGSGNSRLVGGKGSDTYVFSKGHGQDFINEQGDARTASTDTIQLKDVNSANVKFDRVGNHLVLSGYNGTDSVTVEHFFTHDQYTIEKFEFADKTITFDTLFKEGITFTSNDAIVNGWNGVNIMTGGDNNQTLNGGTSNDVITTGAGNNVVVAGTGNDTIIDGSGNNRLVGGKGSDTYVFSRGHGQDVINEQGDSSVTSTDVVKFTNISSNEVNFTRVGNHLVMIGSNDDQLTVEHFFTNKNYAIEKFEFTDTTLNYNDLINIAEIIVDPAPVEMARALNQPEAISTEQSVQSLISAMASFSPSTEGSIQVPDQTYGYLTPIAASSY